jgi:hypothetical protein
VIVQPSAFWYALAAKLLYCVPTCLGVACSSDALNSGCDAPEYLLSPAQCYSSNTALWLEGSAIFL